MNLLCWEGYEADNILGEFSRQRNIQCHAQTLLSDNGTAQMVAERQTHDWDLININNPWVRDYLCHQGIIATLDEDRFAYTQEKLLPEWERLSHWVRDDRGSLIGVGQRFGAFNFVVNTDRIDRRSAEDQSYDLTSDGRLRFGILTYDDFNVFHICIGAGLNPFEKLDESARALFSATASDWFGRASVITDDHLALNRALIAGDIDFYISGGVYTVSEARLAGYNQLRSITPSRGCINGRGGIVFAEITSAFAMAKRLPDALEFLEYMVRPEIAVRIAATENTLNPVAQMGDPNVFSRFTTAQLDAIQWESLSEDVARCAMYRIPPDFQDLHQRLHAAKRSGALCGQQKK